MENTENSNTQIETLPENEKSNQPSSLSSGPLPLKKRKNKNRKLAGW